MGYLPTSFLPVFHSLYDRDLQTYRCVLCFDQQGFFFLVPPKIIIADSFIWTNKLSLSTDIYVLVASNIILKKFLS